MASFDSNSNLGPDPTTDQFRLPGVAIITGAGSDIGRETALTLARAGVRGLTLSDLKPESLHDVAKASKDVSTNPQFETLEFDVNVADDERMGEMVRQTVEKFGRIDYGVNSAGIAYQTTFPITEYSADELQLLHDVHVKGTLNFMKHVIRAMLKQEEIRTHSRGANRVRYVGRGAIVNMASLAGVIGLPNIVPYSTAKAAVIAATKAAALEVRGKGIRVNCVAPTAVKGPMSDEVNARRPGREESLTKLVPLGRLAELEEVADAIVFLCSPLASYLHGLTLKVDGGMSVTAS